MAMVMSNRDIANVFIQLADLLEIKGENPFRIRAYRNAARVIAGLSKNVSELASEGFDFTTLPGVGKDLAQKIITISKTGKLPLLKEIEAAFPAVLTELLKIEGLGPKRVRLLYEKLGINNLKDLKKAIDQGKLTTLAGFGKKIEEKIRSGLEHVKTYSERMKLADAFFIVDHLTRYLKKSSSVKLVECAGSFRRRKETVGDLDFLVTANANKPVINHFVKYEGISEIISSGDTRSTVRLKSGLQIDLRVVNPKSYGAALLYFTGSKAHNIVLRKMAMQKKLKINEYGVFKGKKDIASETETEIYHLLGMEYIEPEMREDRGEIELAKKHKLPRLVTLKNIRGDLHCHSKFSDGSATIEEMVKEARSLGYEYIAITDHTQHLTIAHGMNKKELLAQMRMIDKLNARLKDIVILKSAEVDILEDGKLDLPDDVLQELDLTVCSIHSKFSLPQKKQTERIIRAMDNRYFNILGHATGRLINAREPYSLDLERVMEAAKDRGCIMEVNAQPSRLDLDDVHCIAAKEMHLKLAISSDAHSVSQLRNMCFGVYQARRGWLEAGGCY